MVAVPRVALYEVGNPLPATILAQNIDPRCHVRWIHRPTAVTVDFNLVLATQLGKGGRVETSPVTSAQTEALHASGVRSFRDVYLAGDSLKVSHQAKKALRAWVESEGLLETLKAELAAEPKQPDAPDVQPDDPAPPLVEQGVQEPSTLAKDDG
jgi:hypothetical protein